MKTKRHPLRLGRTGYPVAFTLADPAVARLPRGFSLRGGLSRDLTLSRVDVRLKPRQDALAAEP